MKGVVYLSMTEPLIPQMDLTEDRLVTRQELSIRWQCSLSTIKRLQAQGVLTPLKIGPNVVRYRLSSILKTEEEAERRQASSVA
ncbi:MAG: hypothetical protein CMO55_20410 [Verrucomicrobiales bacterium]|nr:hypothetical protein [Verrucomicrobiales bacterium]